MTTPTPATVYQIEWPNGLTDVFSDLADARHAYRDLSPTYDADLIAGITAHGRSVPVDDAESPRADVRWSPAAKAKTGGKTC